MPVKKGKANATVKTGSGQDIQIIESVVTADENPQASDVEKFVMKGKVFDGEDKSAIVGAVVTIQGSKKGSVTDKDGNFCLEVSVGDRIEVMYVGYDTYTIGVSKAYAKDRTYMIALYKDGTSPNKEIFDQAETMPEFPGGVGKLMEYVAMNVRYPKEAEDKCLQGRVIATFIVEKDGSITSAKIVRSIDPALDAEALRVINGMPNWKPGTQKGEPVRVKYTIPISFRLQGGGDIPAENVKGANVMNETVVVGYGPENEPYVIVDGKPIDGSKLKEIDPKTIDHMEVLKSQPAIEKYGEKAKNGVIIITTKK
jgi:TonB family protein